MADGEIDDSSEVWPWKYYAAKEDKLLPNMGNVYCFLNMQLYLGQAAIQFFSVCSLLRH